MFRKIVLGVLAAAVFMTPQLASAVPANVAIPCNVASGMIFNRPHITGSTKNQQYALSNTVNCAIDATRPGDVISFALYGFDIQSSADALAKANKRGVHVRVIMDDHINSPQQQQLARVLGQDITKSSYFIRCNHSCFSSTSGFTHAKIYLFSRILGTGGRDIKNIAMTGSGNLTVTNSEHSWNNTRVIVGNTTIYGSLKKYVEDMRFDKTNLHYYRTTTSGQYFVGMYPQGSATPDRLYDVIKNVHCIAGKGFGYNGKTVVRLVMYAFQNTRKRIADKLVALKKAGCNVMVIYNNNPAALTLGTQIAPTLLNGGVPTYDGRVDNTRDGIADVYQHWKTLIISGKQGTNNVNKVYTGSCNLSRSSQINSADVMLRIQSRTITNQFLSEFELMRKYSHRETKAPRTTLSTTDGRRTLRGLTGENQDD